MANPPPPPPPGGKCDYDGDGDKDGPCNGVSFSMNYYLDEKKKLKETETKRNFIVNFYFFSFSFCQCDGNGNGVCDVAEGICVGNPCCDDDDGDCPLCDYGKCVTLDTS